MERAATGSAARTYTPSTSVGARLTRLAGDLIAVRHSRRGRLCILNYHRILPAADPLLGTEPDVATFRWQMQALADYFNVLPLSEAVDPDSSRPLPPRAVCITFDDGYRSTHDLALPILREYGFPATVFVTTGFVNEGSMWNDRILTAVRELRQDSLDLSSIGLGHVAVGTLDERRRAVEIVTETAKYLPPEQRESVIDRLAKMSGQCDPDQMLTESMLRSMVKQDIEIGAHTVSHPILTRLDDPGAMYEIAESKRQLEAIIEQPVRYFAYPNGKNGIDFNERHMAMAREAGFIAAFTTAPGAVTAAHDRFALPRARPWDRTPGRVVLRLLRWLA
jgi:peptidoglycan/xylan/chitin deacetylase (PgdA/CDA1 family)